METEVWLPWGYSGYSGGDGDGDGSSYSDGSGSGDGHGYSDGSGRGGGVLHDPGDGSSSGDIDSGEGHGDGGIYVADPPDPWDAVCGLVLSGATATAPAGATTAATAPALAGAPVTAMAGASVTRTGPGPGERGDPLERHYTPDAIAIAATRRLQEQVRPFCWGHGLRLAELHVGGGAWVRAARQVWGGSMEILAVDADPDAIGLRMEEVDRSLHGDLLDPEILSAVSDFDPSVILGNPPFRGAVDHLRAVREAVPDAVIAWVLQSDLHSVAYWLDALEELRPRYIWPLEGRPWPRSVRGCSVWVWVPRRWVYPRWDQPPTTDRGASWQTYIEPMRWKNKGEIR